MGRFSNDIGFLKSKLIDCKLSNKFSRIRIPPIKYYYIEGLNLCNSNTARYRTLAFSHGISNNHIINLLLAEGEDNRLGNRTSRPGLANLDPIPIMNCEKKKLIMNLILNSKLKLKKCVMIPY